MSLSFTDEELEEYFRLQLRARSYGEMVLKYELTEGLKDHLGMVKQAEDFIDKLIREKRALNIKQ